MFRLMLRSVASAACLLYACPSFAANHVILRCVASLDPYSAIHGEFFKRSVSELNLEESEAFSRYLELLCEDVARNRHHLADLPAAKKEAILRSLLDKGDPWELAQAFVDHRRTVTRLIGDGLPSGSAESLDAFEALIKRFSRFSTVPVEGPLPPVVAPKPHDIEQPIAIEQPERAAPVPAEEDALPESVEAISQITANTVHSEYAQAQMQRALRHEKLATIIGDMLDPQGGNNESRLLALLISRIESLLATGSFGEIGNLSVHPESPNILTRGRILREAFRNVEQAKRQYDEAQAHIKFYDTLLGLRAFWVRGREDVRDLISGLRASEAAALQTARQTAGPDLTAYLAVKSYLELVISNPQCSIQCRVNALQTLAGIGMFDVYIESQRHPNAIEINAQIETAISTLEPEERALADAALTKLKNELNENMFFHTAEINQWKNSDPALLAIVSRKTLRRRFWGAVSNVYHSNAFGKVLRLLQTKTRLDWLPGTELFARNARDRGEILNSVGTLLVLARSDLPVAVKFANLEALAAVHPQALVTLHRHSLFRGLLADAKTVKEGDEERLKEQFGLLFEQIETAAKHPDADRLLNLHYDLPTVTKLANATINIVVVAAALVNVANPEFHGEMGWMPDSVREMLTEWERPVVEVLEENPDLRDDLTEQFDTDQRRSPSDQDRVELEANDTSEMQGLPD